ncbi:MAG: hypothetical protein AB8B79_11940 [Granulosicoccus sp.]
MAAVTMIPILLYCILTTLVAGPVVVAATSPLLSGREAVYIVGGMSGVVALALLLLQPILASGYLPSISSVNSKTWHRRIGFLLVLAITLHILGLYLTSPDDLMDALLLISPAPFSLYGVAGMWAIIVTTLLVVLRSLLSWRHTLWKLVHNVLGCIVVVTSVTHAMMIDGAMGYRSKLILCIAIIVLTIVVIVHFRIIKPLAKRNRK